MTLAQAKAEALRRLSVAGLEDPVLEVQVLLGHVGFDRVRQILDAHTPIDDDTLTSLMSLVDRRAARVPMAYLTGHREFYGLDFTVTSDTLIPRPDTETLVEVALSRGAHIPCPRILDLCTGTGCVGISIAHSIEVSSLTLVDISPRALEVARLNASRILGDSCRWRCIEGDLMCNIEDDAFDIMVSNPPYIAPEWMECLSPEVMMEPSLALRDDDDDGLGIERRIVDEAVGHLADGGVLALECDYRQARDLESYMKARGYVDTLVTKDLAGLERVVSARFAKRSPKD